MSHIIHYDYKQNSNEWFRARKKFSITASLVANIISASANSKTYLKLVQEKATGHRIDFSSEAMKHGVECEELAKIILKKKYPNLVEVGLIHNTKYPDCAASPDGIIKASTHTLVEIKCPYSREMKKEIPIGYLHQIQFQMLITEASQCLYAEFKFTPNDHKYIKSWQKIVKFDENWYPIHREKIENFIKSVKNYSWIDTIPSASTKVVEVESECEDIA